MPSPVSRRRVVLATAGLAATVGLGVGLGMAGSSVAGAQGTSIPTSSETTSSTPITNPTSSSSSSSSSSSTSTTQFLTTTTTQRITTTQSTFTPTSTQAPTTTAPGSTSTTEDEPGTTRAAAAATSATTEKPTTTTAAPEPDPIVDDAPTSGRPWGVVGGLVAIAGVFGLLTFLYWRHTTPVEDGWYDDDLDEDADGLDDGLDDGLAPIGAASAVSVGGARPTVAAPPPAPVDASAFAPSTVDQPTQPIAAVLGDDDDDDDDEDDDDGELAGDEVEAFEGAADVDGLADAAAEVHRPKPALEPAGEPASLPAAVTPVAPDDLAAGDRSTVSIFGAPPADPGPDTPPVVPVEEPTGVPADERSDAPAVEPTGDEVVAPGTVTMDDLRRRAEAAYQAQIEREGDDAGGAS